MPTVGIYVPMAVARNLASRWKIDVEDNELHELVRSLAAEAIEDAAGISPPSASFIPSCQAARLHRTGHRCRHCGGS